MISIKRTTCPDHLDTSHKKLVEDDYQDETVIDALLSMQHFKCCYCEKDLTLIGKSAKWVEHFIARTDKKFKEPGGIINWNRANAWTNLLYACSTCNRSKSAENPFDPKTGKRRLLDPSDLTIDPEHHIGFFIEDVLIAYISIRGSQLGENSLKKLKARIDIYALLLKRKLEIDSIFTDLVKAMTEDNKVMATSKQNDLKKMTSAHQPHASFCRKYILQIIEKFNKDTIYKINKHLGLNLKPIAINLAFGYQVIV